MRPKRVRLSGNGQALENIASAATDFVEILGGFRELFAFTNTTAPATPAPHAAAPPAAPAGPALPTQIIFQTTPSRKHAAVTRAQQLETYLVASDLAILIDILSMSTAKADAYNAIVVDAVRVYWVQEQLRKHMLENGLQLDI